MHFRHPCTIAIVTTLAALSIATDTGRAATAPSAAPTSSATPAASTPASPRVEFFAPRGTVKGVRQATARFSEEIVALGDPRLPDPFDVQCGAKGTGRWADGRNWVYDFDTDLPAGESCRFTLKPGLQSLSGRALTGTRSFAFDTGGPAVIGSLPREGWSDVDEEQIFLLKLDAPAPAASIAAHAYCVVDGIGERIPVAVLEGERRAQFLKNRAAIGYDYYWLLWQSGDTDGMTVRSRTFEQQDAALVALQCQRRLPPATRMKLVWGRGIASESGIATRADQSLAFRVRAAFDAQVSCQRTNARAGCIPTLPIAVSFSAPVPTRYAQQIRLVDAQGRRWTPTLDAPQAPNVEQVTFAGPFPESVTLQVVLPPELRDDAGRVLANAARFPLDLRIDAYPPLAKFAASFGILEAREGGVLPVTLRNVEPTLAAQQLALPARSLRVADPAQIAAWLRRVAKAQQPRGEWLEDPDASRRAAESNARGEPADEAAPGGRVWREDTGSASVFTAADTPTAFTVSKPAGDRPAEVVGIPLGKPGLYVVEIESRRLGQALLGRDRPRYVATAALVTNLSVHFKWGRESSLVWVTRLDDARPVAGAEIAIADGCSGSVAWRGRTDAQGIARVAQSLGTPHSGSACESWAPRPLLVTATSGDDVSFAQSSWADGITPYTFNLPTGSEYEADVYHTTFDRALFRAGETVSMKHFVRRHRGTGIAVLPGVPATRRLVIAHRDSGQEYELEAAFGADGVATSQWRIPAEAKLGEYLVSIADARGDRTRTSGRFQVQQFRLPSMRASVSGPAKALVRPESVPLDLHVAYLSGGGAAGLPVKVRTVVEPWTLQYRDYPDYAFGGAPVKEGIVTGGAFDAFDFERPPQQEPAAPVRVLPLTLDAAGGARVTIEDLPKLDTPLQLVAELEYPDANGQLLSATGRVRLATAALSLGIRSEGWVASPKQLRFRVLAVDLDGRPQASVPVQVSLYRQQSYSYRKRLVGGFYAYESTTATTRIDAACDGMTNAQGLVLCELAPGVSGEVLVRAEARDASGNLAGATSSMWLAGEDDWWFGGTTGDRMDVLPEKKEYEAGETARFQVRMPFRRATALVTVEREGVIDGFVAKLDGRGPVVEVPIAGHYAPNVFVSVLAVRGRVPRADGGKVAKQDEVTATVDLRKPAYRLGVAKIAVGWKPHRLDVQVTPEREIYRIREQAKVRVRVARADGQPLPAGTEFALAAVDEALLDLAPNPSWQLLDAMMGERGIEVWTSTAQLQVVGRRHFGRKAVPHGGGGGRERDRGRELFDSLLTWQPRVRLDANGEATLAVPVNDSLTAFRIVAVAHGGAQYFGTGSATIRTSQDLILVSGLPPLVREGDAYSATFTVRNTTDRAIVAVVDARLAPAPATPLPAQRIELAAGQSQDVTWQVVAPYDAGETQWQVGARDANGTAKDVLRVAALVRRTHPVRTYQSTIAQLAPAPAAPVSIVAEQPVDAIPGRGGLEITLRAKLGDGLDGVREYMSEYPYTCLEQNLSRAVALRDRALWDTWLERLPAYLDRDGLLRYFPSDSIDGDDTLTAYVLAIASEAGYPIDDAVRLRLIDALSRFVSGRIVRRSALPSADLTIRKLAAIDALSRYGAANPAMLDSLDLAPTLWPTSAVIDWLGILDRVEGVPRAVDRRREALGILRARLNFQGTTLGFSTERRDALWWLMISGDSNANRMLLAVLARPEWREDVPRLVRGALGRQRNGHWNTTVANAWGVLAMAKFSAAFESTPVTGTTVLSYAKRSDKVAWPAKDGTAEVSMPWEFGRNRLAVAHGGTGRPWAIVRATAALPLQKPLSSGYRIVRNVAPVEQQAAGRWTRGDTFRVQLELEAQSDMSWVVVDDPVPAGATIVGSGLGGQSQIATRTEQRAGGAWLAYEERRFDAFRAYYRFVPKGTWTVEYTIRLDNPGTFQLPSTRVEALYAPEMSGEIPNPPVTVEPRP